MTERKNTKNNTKQNKSTIIKIVYNEIDKECASSFILYKNVSYFIPYFIIVLINTISLKKIIIICVTRERSEFPMKINFGKYYKACSD